jgi:hypothetical protein
MKERYKGVKGILPSSAMHVSVCVCVCARERVCERE